MIFKRYFNQFETAIRIIAFIARNCRKAMCIPTLVRGGIDDVEFLPCTLQFVPHVVNLYSIFHPGLSLGKARCLLLYLLGPKVCIVVRDRQTQKIVGYSLFYFNIHDYKERTIHEGDTGLLSEFRGRGLGTELRRHALYHFARSSFLKGVSSRVSLNNVASLKSNKNLGFKVIEKYFDPCMNEERVYLICDLEPYREKRKVRE